MPDDPLNAPGSPSPEDKLRKLIEDIEKEAPSQPPAAPAPSNDEIRADVHQSPIESQLSYSPTNEDGSVENELSDEERQLQEFDERLKRARSSVELPEPPDWDYKRPNYTKKNKVEENDYMGMGVGISIAYTMVGCILAGWGIGKLIDLRGTGSLGQAIGTLIGAVVGLVAAIVTIVKAQNKPSK